MGLKSLLKQSGTQFSIFYFQSCHVQKSKLIPETRTQMLSFEVYFLFCCPTFSGMKELTQNINNWDMEWTGGRRGEGDPCDCDANLTVPTHPLSDFFPRHQTNPAFLLVFNSVLCPSSCVMLLITINHTAISRLYVGS